MGRHPPRTPPRSQSRNRDPEKMADRLGKHARSGIGMNEINLSPNKVVELSICIHDREFVNSWWMFFVSLIPIIGAIIQLFYYFRLWRLSNALGLISFCDYVKVAILLFLWFLCKLCIPVVGGIITRCMRFDRKISEILLPPSGAGLIGKRRAKAELKRYFGDDPGFIGASEYKKFLSSNLTSNSNNSMV